MNISQKNENKKNNQRPAKIIYSCRKFFFF